MPPEDEEKKSPLAGVIPRRINMPIGMWSEIVRLSKAGGVDHRDTVVALLDLGLQAQAEDSFQPRIVRLEQERWDALAELAKEEECDEDEALVKLLDLGLQARQLEKRQKEIRAKQPAGWSEPNHWVDAKIESSGKPIARCSFPGGLPVEGEVLTIKGKHYVVEQRAWAISKEPLAILRVKPYPGIQPGTS